MHLLLRHQGQSCQSYSSVFCCENPPLYTTTNNRVQERMAALHYDMLKAKYNNIVQIIFKLKIMSFFSHKYLVSNSSMTETLLCTGDKSNNFKKQSLSASSVPSKNLSLEFKKRKIN